MQKSWRSWFWNIVLLIVMAIFFMISLMVAVDYVRERNWPPVALFGSMAAIAGMGGVRAFMIGVTATPHGVVSRGLTKTSKIAWSDIETITDHASVEGPAGLAGATAPGIVRRPSEGKQKTVILEGLGSYGLTRRGTTLGERAVIGLNHHLARWRAHNGISDDEGG